MMLIIAIFAGLFIWNKLSSDNKAGATGAVAGAGLAVLFNLALVAGAIWLIWKFLRK